MNILSHLAYPAIIFIFAAKIFSIDYSFFDLLILMFFSIAPDFDLAIAALFEKNREKFSLSDIVRRVLLLSFPGIGLLGIDLLEQKRKPHFPKHRLWPSHLPLSYSPLFIFLVFFRPCQLKIWLIGAGLFSHLLLDSLFWGDGIGWLYPFSKKLFLFKPFKLKGWNNKSEEGERFFSRYQHSFVYYSELIAFLALLLIVLKKFVLK
jgi:hypothetical protein